MRLAPPVGIEPTTNGLTSAALLEIGFRDRCSATELRGCDYSSTSGGVGSGEMQLAPHPPPRTFPPRGARLGNEAINRLAAMKRAKLVDTRGLEPLVLADYLRGTCRDVSHVFNQPYSALQGAVRARRSLTACVRAVKFSAEKPDELGGAGWSRTISHGLRRGRAPCRQPVADLIGATYPHLRLLSKPQIWWAVMPYGTAFALPPVVGEEGIEPPTFPNHRSNATGVPTDTRDALTLSYSPMEPEDGLEPPTYPQIRSALSLSYSGKLGGRGSY